PAKIALTKRFFADPGLPPTIKCLRRRSISSVYVRTLDYFQRRKPRHWLLAVRLLVQAIVVDPGNIGFIWQRFTRLFPAFARAARICSRPVISIRGILVRLASPRATLKDSLAPIIDRVFARGNRRLKLEIGGLQERMEALERAASEGLQHVVARLDRIAE